MNGEKYQFDEVSSSLIENLFDTLETHTKKEFGSGWEQRRLQSVFARKAISLYVQHDAERLISEYLYAENDSIRTEAELEAEMTYRKRTETHDIDVAFEAERYPAEENDSDISTVYTIRLASTTELDDITDVPEQIRSQVAENLTQAEIRHQQQLDKKTSGSEAEDDFDESLSFSKCHIFVLKEMQESLSYTIEHSYVGADFSVPALTYTPGDEPNTPLFTVTSTAAAEHIPNRQERDNTLAQFEELMKYQEIERPVAKRPAEIRVAQILAILALLQFGEAQTPEEEAIIKDLA
jgi:hypothetical protein